MYLLICNFLYGFIILFQHVESTDKLKIINLFEFNKKKQKAILIGINQQNDSSFEKLYLLDKNKLDTLYKIENGLFVNKNKKIEMDLYKKHFKKDEKIFYKVTYLKLEERFSIDLITNDYTLYLKEKYQLNKCMGCEDMAPISVFFNYKAKIFTFFWP